MKRINKRFSWFILIPVELYSVWFYFYIISFLSRKVASSDCLAPLSLARRLRSRSLCRYKFSARLASATAVISSTHLYDQLDLYSWPNLYGARARKCASVKSRCNIIHINCMISRIPKITKNTRPKKEENKFRLITRTTR